MDFCTPCTLIIAGAGKNNIEFPICLTTLVKYKLFRDGFVTFPSILSISDTDSEVLIDAPARLSSKIQNKPTVLDVIIKNSLHKYILTGFFFQLY